MHGFRVLMECNQTQIHMTNGMPFTTANARHQLDATPLAHTRCTSQTVLLTETENYENLFAVQLKAPPSVGDSTGSLTALLCKLLWTRVWLESVVPPDEGIRGPFLCIPCYNQLERTSKLKTNLHVLYADVERKMKETASRLGVSVATLGET